MLWQMTSAETSTETLNSLYAVVYTQLSHMQSRALAKKGLCDTEDMQNSTDEYVAFFQKKVSWNSHLTKHHIVAMHCVDFMQNTGLGLGLHGEQGEQEADALINSLKRRAWGLRSETDRLMLIMHEHIIIINNSYKALFFNES